MIRNKKDLDYVLGMDKIANHKSKISTIRQLIANWIFPDSNYEYVRCLRKVEYFMNCSTTWGAFKILLY